MTEYHTEQVETPAGTYTVELHTDEDSGNPLTEWCHDGMAFRIHSPRDGVQLDTLDDAGPAGNAVRMWLNDMRSAEEIERRFAKWVAITGNPWRLFTGSQSYYYRWFVLVDTSDTYIASDGKSYPSLPDPQRVAAAAMEDYRIWAAGEVCGFITTSPDGTEVESVWGFYDEDDALAEGRDAAHGDAVDRLEQSHRVGSGFVGLI